MATAGLEEANKVVVVYEEQAIAGYQIRIGEDGPSQRVYNLGEDFTYYGVAKITAWNPILPYAFDPENPMMTLFLAGTKFHYRVEYMYDFGDDGEGIDGTLRMRATWRSDDFFSFVTPGSFKITSLEGTGDLQNVNVKATNTIAEAGSAHLGTVIGWPE